MTSFRDRSGWILVAASHLLLLFTVYCFARQPDRFAAFTVMPIWLWGGFGMAISAGAFYFLRARFSRFVTALWFVTLLVGADEARALLHFGKSPPLPGPALPHDGRQVIRVITLNSAFFTYGSPMADIARWQPDIVLMQEVFPYQANLLATLLYGGKGDFRSHETNGVVTRWKIVREFHSAAKRDEQLTVEMPGGRQIQIVNVHLATAATDLRLWRRSAWAEHRQNRLVRRNELDLTLTTLRSTTQFPEVPTLFGGDFNSPASDVVHRQLSGDFVDAFAKAGTGWGDTFQHRFPILRIDHIYATRQFTAVRCRVVNTRNSDHRMVVADFVLE